MGRVFTAFGLKPDALHQPLLLGLRIKQGLRRRYRRDHRARLTAAERRQSFKIQFESITLDAAEQERLMQRIGLEPEGRKYTPHVTLARLRDSSSHVVAEYLSARGYFRTCLL